MKYILMPFVFLLVILIGCSKNNPIGPSNQTDSELKAELTGTRSNGVQLFNLMELEYFKIQQTNQVTQKIVCQNLLKVHIQ